MIISVCNQKGGVGKTTLATNIAQRLSENGRHAVLLIDADPQGNASTTVGADVGTETLTLNDALTAVASGAPGSVITQTIMECMPPWTISLIPADRLLASRESDTSLGRENRLKTLLEAVQYDFEHVVIDCPPSLGMLTTNALVASDKALVVTTARETSFDGVAEITSTIATVRAHYNPDLVLSGVVVNSYRADRLDRREWFDHLQTYYGAHLLPNAIPEREAIAAAASRHEPIGYIDDATCEALNALINAIKKGSK
ncbi:ParA family protein [Arcanobacterium bovis]|uniref:ParA family protein n=1 Tax=Arcanobacterium bovis TaxID=2529275 RepID=A0A4Q9UYI1_9ACTO|nr:ParA family protein [Arcanobacterium bovis]TBW20698.1 ParA family protein [Arcanobacterium bovis]